MQGKSIVFVQSLRQQLSKNEKGKGKIDENDYGLQTEKIPNILNAPCF